MAALLGSIQGSRGEATRLGSKESGMDARAQTWHTFAHVFMDADGSGYFDLRDDRGRTITSVSWNAESNPVDARVTRHSNGGTE
jgi:hypothetical protein